MYKKFLFIIIILISLNGCIIVKLSDTGDVAPTVNLSPKPELEMSDVFVRSKQGDMLAFLPKGWFLVDVLDQVSAEVFAVAANPEYNLSAVFVEFRQNEQLSATVQKEGLLGLARLSFARHERKTSGTIRLIGKYSPLEMGPNSFVKYQYSSTGGGLSSSIAVFKSSLNQYYEFALVPMDITHKPVPTAQEIEKIFQSFVAGIKL